MTPLRQRYVEDMQIRNLSPKTIQTYTHHVAVFAAFCGKSPEDLGPEDIRRWQLDLVQRRKVSWSTFNQAVCALKWLYRVTLPRLLTELRAYYRQKQPGPILFPGLFPDRPINAGTVQKACREAAERAGLKKHVTPHVLRHSFATNLLEAGVDMDFHQHLLGHSALSTTLIYLHCRRPHLEALTSPLDWLPVAQCPRVIAPRPE